jgi:hypothetical protein
MESFPVPALVAAAFVVGAIVVGYGIRAFISARRRARAQRHGFQIAPADRDSTEGPLAESRPSLQQDGTVKAKPIRPVPSGKPWTKADEKQLLEMVDAGKSEAEIGTVLDRTPRAVAARLKRLRRAHNNPSLAPEADPH